MGEQRRKVTCCTFLTHVLWEVGGTKGSAWAGRSSCPVREWGGGREGGHSPGVAARHLQCGCCDFEVNVEYANSNEFLFKTDT